MTTFLLTGTILPVLADGPLVNARYYGTGKYSTVAAGVGMVDYTARAQREVTAGHGTHTLT